MIRVRYLRSFDASLSAMARRDQEAVRSALHRLLDYFSGKPRSLGLGLRKLRGGYWEIRASLDKRVLFRLEGDLAVFILVGNHDELTRVLRRR